MKEQIKEGVSEIYNEIITAILDFIKRKISASEMDMIVEKCDDMLVAFIENYADAKLERVIEAITKFKAADDEDYNEGIDTALVFIRKELSGNKKQV